jgi:hypothetical protein
MPILSTVNGAVNRKRNGCSGAPSLSTLRGRPFFRQSADRNRSCPKQVTSREASHDKQVTTRSGSACLFESEGLGQTCPQVVTLI